MLRALVLVTALSAQVVAGQGRARSGFASALDSISREAVKPGRLSGMTVMIVHRSDTLLHKAYGVADITTNAPTPVDAIYEIGSVTKQFTAAAILQLVRDGRLRLDDPLPRALPGYDDQGRRVTLRHLLDHTSGIRSYTSMRGFGAIEAKPGSRDSLIRAISKEKFDFNPRERMSYSNSGYFLLGRIIERASGESYADYVAKHLFAPAGMTSSSYCDRGRATPRTTRGHTVSGDRLVRASDLDHTWPFAAGSLCSTAADLVRWTRAMHSGKILSPAEYAEWLRPDTLANGFRLRYAKGVAVDSLLGHRVARHGGDISGFRSEVDHFPDDSLTIVVLMNTQGPARPLALATLLAARVFGTSNRSSLTMKGPASDYTGTYQPDGEGPSLLVKAEKDGTITVQASDGPLLHPTWIGEDLLENSRLRYRFTRTAGKVTGLVYDQVYAVTPLRRKRR